MNVLRRVPAAGRSVRRPRPVTRRQLPIPAAVCLVLLMPAAGLCAAVPAAPRVVIEKIRIIDWDERAAPLAGMAGKVKARRAGERFWKQVLVRYRCRTSVPAVKLHWYVLINGESYGRLVLWAARTQGQEHEPGRYEARMFVSPDTVRRFGVHAIEAVAVQASVEGIQEDKALFPADYAGRWDERPMIAGLLVDRLESPWAHLAPDRWGALHDPPDAERWTGKKPGGPTDREGRAGQ